MDATETAATPPAAKLKFRDTPLGRFLKALSGSRRMAQPDERWYERFTRSVAGFFYELLTVALSLSMVWLGLLAFFLSRGEVDLEVMKPFVQQRLLSVADGRSIEVDSYRAVWLPEDGSVAFIAGGIEIRDAEGKTVSEAPSILASLSLDDLAIGRRSVSSLHAEGGDFILSRREDGSFDFGLGTLSDVDNFDALFNFRLDEERPSGQNFATPVSALNSIRLDNTDLVVADQTSGFLTSLENISMTLERSESLDFKLNGSFLSETGELSPLQAKITASSDYRDFTAALELRDLSPASLSPATGPASILSKLDTTMDMTLDIRAEADKGLTDIALDIAMSDGQWLSDGAVFYNFDRAQISARYDPESERLNFDTLDVMSDIFSLVGTANLTDIGNPGDGFLTGDTGYNIDIESLEFDAGDFMEAPVAARNIRSGGTFNLDESTITLDGFTATLDDLPPPADQSPVGDVSLSLDGSIALRAAENGETFPAIDLDGAVLGELWPEALIRWWPVPLGDGARRWVAGSVLEGRISNIDFRANIPPDAFANESLSDEHLTMTFNVREGVTKYISTMTPVTAASGSATLLGNQMTLDVSSGQIGDLTLESGDVHIPYFSPKGADFVINITGSGRASDFLGLIDQKPFEYPSKFGLDPQTIGGQGRLQFRITRPLLEYFDQDRITYAVSGNFEGASLPLPVGGLTLSNGDIELQADKTGIEVAGMANLGPWRHSLSWIEPLGDDTAPTTYRLEGPVTRDILNDMGIGGRQFFGGDANLVLSASGDGLDVSAINMRADLTAAELNVLDRWAKDKGTAASVSAVIGSDQNNLSIEDIIFEAPDAALEGYIIADASGRLLQVGFEEFRLPGLADMQAALQRSGEDKFIIRVDGNYVDLSGFTDGNLLGGSGSGLGLPLRADMSLESLILSEELTLREVNAVYDNDGEITQLATLDARLGQGQIKLDMQPGSDGIRRIDFETDQAGTLMSIFAGIENIEGGDLVLSGAWPDGVQGGLNGDIVISDFMLVDAPALAQLLSLGSLTGLADTLSGEGLRFSELSTPFVVQDGILQLQELNASGPALGITAKGNVNFDDKNLDLEGVIVPSYTLNSIFNDIPLIGDIVGSRRGEGVFALTYTMAGDFDETQVAVNPLSALTPGVLRRIFQSQDLPEIPDAPVKTQETDPETPPEEAAD